MGNILNHNRDIFKLELDNSEYWDFHIDLTDYSSLNDDSGEKLYDNCLISYIDTLDKNCIQDNRLLSKRGYKWNDFINSGFIFKNIGYTGVDNGILKYDKYFINNSDFLNIFYNSSLKMNRDDYRLMLNKVDGNNKIYDYDCRIEDDNSIRLNGGFYQGFWKTEDTLYQVLPDNIGNGWTLEFTLKKSELKNNKYTINDAHKNNKGIFFYIGTRAENKWWKYYNAKEDFKKSLNDFFEDSYISNDENCLNDEYTSIDNENECDNYFESDYLEKQTDIDENDKLYTDNGIEINKPYNGYEIKTDNKFILFNRTKDGFTTENWDEDYQVILDAQKKPDVGNYFLLFNRTEDGYTTENIDTLLNEKSMEYSVNDDLYGNAFCLQINENGEIGYKFLIKDCENEGKYKIEKEFTKYKLINNDIWYNIAVTFEPISDVDKCTKDLLRNKIYNKMVIKIYVNGKLKLISKELPLFDFRKLNDSYNKQEGVPYNISVGGGTQGLCDVIYLNFLKEPEYILPLEKEFCGSFVGYLKNFRFHDCVLNYQEILNNYHFDKKYHSI